MYFFSKILHLVLFIVATSIIFSILGFDLLPLITSVGIIGLAIALAAQQTVKDFIGGILLVTDKPFRHSDYVRVGDFDGRVVKIGLRTTQIKTTTNSILIVPNSDITSQNIINYSVNNEAVRYELKIGVEYGSDISNVRKILLSAASKSKFVSKEKKPEVYFLDFGEYSLNFSVLIRVNFLNRRKARDDVNTNIYIYIMHLKNTKLRYLFPSVLFI
ncbi:MAG: hypothetical protein CVU81_01430 [Euryarchaeota archaeon HGW-Euryarchaeota-1]|nr:MAG: hypothetical protein CVU81_01430 [Euryarchaeota archaeon HGW-Euryarchaeota-1]